MTGLPSLARLRPRDDLFLSSRDFTVLAAGRDGFIQEADQGLFVHETRLLSRYRWLVNGRPPRAAALSAAEQDAWAGYYILLPPGADPGAADQGSGQVPPETVQTLELRLLRRLGAGLHEDVELVNYSRRETAFDLALEADADFSDLSEIYGERQQSGELLREWREAGYGAFELLFGYTAEHDGVRLVRGAALRVENAGSPPSFAAGSVAFRVELPPLGRWRACLGLIPVIDGRRAEAVGCPLRAGRNPSELRRNLFLRESTAFASPESGTLTPVVRSALERAKRDLADLRLEGLDEGERAWVPAAGIPLYAALFGRDVLTAGWQAGIVTADIMRGGLTELARWQGRTFDDWRDEQPGRMLHEAHTGPVKALGLNPFGRYYGSTTTSALYGLILAELWHWTGDKDLLRPYVGPALDALRWLDRYGDEDGGGFYAYRTRSAQGVRHQGWKDSADALVDEEGRDLEPPVATCEEQGFAYVAKLHMSELLWWLDKKEEARRLYREAEELKKRFNEAFWMPDRNFFAMGLAKGGRKIGAIGSNPGHCVATAIVDGALARKASERLFVEDLFTGWGSRTLSSDNPAYNPYSYHRGSVWPVEHGTFAIGFMRYGLHALTERICRAQFEAAALFEHNRLPEIFSGHPRDAAHPFPALYPRANWPQAWSASAVFNLVQALLGLYPYAPLDLLLVDPHLPAWLPDITLRNLRVGRSAVTIRFFREEDGSSDYRVLDKRGPLHVLHQPSPWSLTAGFGERLRDALGSLRPGR